MVYQGLSLSRGFIRGLSLSGDLSGVELVGEVSL